MTDLRGIGLKLSTLNLQIFTIALVAVGLYLRTISFDFVYDDFLQIVLNPQVTESTFSNIVGLLLEPSPPGNLYRPLTTFTYAITKILFGVSAPYFHALNILIYAATCCVSLLALRKITGDVRASFIGSLLFTIHPLHTEAVANVIGRAEQLATLFALLSLLAVSASVKAVKGSHIGIFASISGVLFLIAALCKESSLALIIPILLLAWHHSPKEAIQSLRFVRMLPAATALCSMSIIALYLRYTALESNFIIKPDGKTWIENPLFNEPFLGRLLPVVAIFGSYLRLLLLPLHQSADYSSSPQYFYQWLSSGDGMLSVSISLLLGYLWWRTRSPTHNLLFIWIVSAFLLTINLITPIGTIMGERLSFAASFGTCGLFGVLANRFLAWRYSLSTILLSLYSTVLILLTSIRIPVWQSNEILFHQTVTDAPSSPKAWYNLGVQALLKEPTSVQAEQHFRAALSLYPDYLLPARALADIMLARKDFGRLEYWYREILRISPQDEIVEKNLSELTKLRGSTP